MENAKSSQVGRLICVLLIGCVSSAMADCGADRYFGPDDPGNRTPLTAAHPDFAKTQRLAARANVVEERNLAVYYETGYMVDRCPDKAALWYEKAAADGDEVARAWVARQAALARLRGGPECFADRCGAAGGDGPQVAFVQAVGAGAFKTMVTINGKTVPAIIDTGATFVTMSAKTAGELGLGYEGGKQMKMNTANGTTTNNAIMLDRVTVGGITLSRVEGAVGQTDMPVLIGMSFLRRVNMTTNGNVMTLVRP